MERIQLEQSDVISFHNYDSGAGVREADPVAAALQAADPLHRVHGARQRQHVRGVAADREEVQGRRVQLGLRRRQDADQPAVGLVAEAVRRREPAVWFHEIFRQDGTPYRQEEVELIRTLTHRAVPAVASAR